MKKILIFMLAVFVPVLSAAVYEEDIFPQSADILRQKGISSEAIAEIADLEVTQALTELLESMGSNMQEFEEMKRAKSQQPFFLIADDIVASRSGDAHQWLKELSVQEQQNFENYRIKAAQLRKSLGLSLDKAPIDPSINSSASRSRIRIDVYERNLQKGYFAIAHEMMHFVHEDPFNQLICDEIAANKGLRQSANYQEKMSVYKRKSEIRADIKAALLNVEMAAGGIDFARLSFVNILENLVSYLPHTSHPNTVVRSRYLKAIRALFETGVLIPRVTLPAEGDEGAIAVREQAVLHAIDTESLLNLAQGIRNNSRQKSELESLILFVKRTLQGEERIAKLREISDIFKVIIPRPRFKISGANGMIIMHPEYRVFDKNISGTIAYIQDHYAYTMTVMCLYGWVLTYSALVEKASVADLIGGLGKALPLLYLICSNIDQMDFIIDIIPLLLMQKRCATKDLLLFFFALGCACY